jgi:hypothetical protein
MKRILLIAVLVFGTTTGTAQAHLVSKPVDKSLSAILKSQTKNLKHTRYVCRNGGRKFQRWHCNVLRWIKKERAETLLALNPPQDAIKYRSAWLCIYSHEKGTDGWRTNTGNGYYGGLQMDYSFMRSYGRHLLNTKGTADKWTPEEQMRVAEKAHRTRGFYPWPRTARKCGLI